MRQGREFCNDDLGQHFRSRVSEHQLQLAFLASKNPTKVGRLNAASQTETLPPFDLIGTSRRNLLDFARCYRKLKWAPRFTSKLLVVR
jgi:hypothetical protein